MKRFLFAVIVFSLVVPSTAQQLTKKLVVKADAKSGMRNVESVSFDRNGNYCFVVRRKEGTYFITNQKTWGPFEHTGGLYGSSGSITYTRDYSENEKEWYYKNPYGITLYGPVKGELRRVTTAPEADSMAISVAWRDSVYYYLNGKLVNVIPKNEAAYIETEDFAAFSPNGRSVYYANHTRSSTLYCGNVILDTSTEFRAMAIDNSGHFIYQDGMRSGEESTISFSIHAWDTTFHKTGPVWNYELREDGSYFCNEYTFLLIDDQYFENIRNPKNVTLLDRSHYFFTYEKDSNSYVNVNGTVMRSPYAEIIYPAADCNGNFACYGIKDFYLYRYVNGKQRDSISRYGVRAMPLWISPTGSSLHYFQTDDSTYIYRDDQQIFPAFANSFHFDIDDGARMMPYHSNRRGEALTGNSLLYLELGEKGYFIYNGVFSRPLKAAASDNYEKKKKDGELVAGACNEYGFYMIQKTGSDTYLLDINNTYYEELKGIDRILPHCAFFDGKQLIFYAQKGNSFYQYTVTR